LDFVEGSTPSKIEKETVDTAEASNVEAPATTARERERERTLDADDEPGLTKTYRGAARDEGP
jgi:hypothetical protein